MGLVVMYRGIVQQQPVQLEQCKVHASAALMMMIEIGLFP